MLVDKLNKEKENQTAGGVIEMLWWTSGGGAFVR